MPEIGHALVTYLLLLLLGAVRSTNNAYESMHAYPSVEYDTCTSKAEEPKVQLKKKITDLTHEMRADLPSFGGENPLGEAVRLVVSMDDGFDYNLSELKVIVHTGTHLDAPGHFIDEHYKAGLDVSSLDLNILVGAVLIVDTPRDSNITAEVLEKLGIPRGVERVLFRTSNTDKGLMWNPKFDSSYTGLSTDGAEWLVHQRPEIKLIGTDYLSVARFDNLKDGHRVLLWKKLVLVEGLNLDNVQVGLSNLYCLPMRLLMAEGCPCRYILVD
ncbi:unnamed protein product [Calypogeia fissa]